MYKYLKVSALYVAVFPSAAAHVEPAAEKEHAGVDMFGSPADCYIEPEPFDDDRTIDHIDRQCDQFQPECGLGTARSRNGKEEHLSAYIEQIRCAHYYERRSGSGDYRRDVRVYACYRLREEAEYQNHHTHDAV